MRSCLIAILCLVLLAGCASTRPEGLSDEAFSRLESAQSFEIVSMYPFDDFEERDEWRSGEWSEKLGGFPIIDTAMLDDPAERREILSAYNRALKTSDGAAGCFYPRHGLRIKDGETWWEIAICYECANAYAKSNEKSFYAGGDVAPGEPAAFRRIWAKHGLHVHRETGAEYQERKQREAEDLSRRVREETERESGTEQSGE